MKNHREKRVIQELLEPTGIQINGTEPFDIHVHNPDFYPEVLARGSLALGESYMDGWWDTETLDQLIYRLYVSKIDNKKNQHGCG